MIEVGDHLLPSPVLCRLGARSFRLSGPQPVVHHIVTARALAPPPSGGSVGGLRPWDLPGGRHPSYAASTFCRFRTFTLWIHGYLQASHNLAERDLRPTVIARKTSFGSTSEAGARTRGILMTVMHTLKKQGANANRVFKATLDALAYDPGTDPFVLLFPASVGTQNRP